MPRYDKKFRFGLLYVRIICCCCLIIALITLIAGRYYMPFYIVSGTFLFLSLLIYVFSAITEGLK